MLTLPSTACFLATAWLAEVIGTMAGFGAATVLTPIASYFLPMKTAVAVVACFHLFGNASRLHFFKRQIRWPIVWRFGLPGVGFAFGAAQMAARLPGHAIRASLGAFLVLYVALELARWSTVRLSPTSTTLVTGGIVSGSIAGLIGTGGAVRSVCLLAFGLPKETYIATSAVIALAVDATRLPVYLAQGFVPTTTWPVLAGLVVMAFLGAWTGQRLVRRISAEAFHRVVLAVLALMGAKLLLDGLRGMG